MENKIANRGLTNNELFYLKHLYDCKEGFQNHGKKIELLQAWIKMTNLRRQYQKRCK